MSQVSSSVEHVTFKPDAGCSNLYNPCHLFRPPQRGGRAPWGRRWRTKYMINFENRNPGRKERPAFSRYVYFVEFGTRESSSCPCHGCVGKTTVINGH